MEPALPFFPRGMRRLYADAHLIVVDKPSGLAVHRGWASDGVTAMTLARDAAGRWVYPVHRLDRGTSGALVFALDPETAARMQALFSAGAVDKRYLALVHGSPAHDDGTWESFLAPVERSARSTRWGSVRAGGKKAITEYRVLRRDGERSLVECRPRTGRTHQLRVHLSEAGHPIVGDERYGAPRGEHERVGRFMLHAWRLTLPSLEGEAAASFEVAPDAGFGPVPPHHPPNA